MIRTCNSGGELYRISDGAPHKNSPCPSLLVPSFYEQHPVLAWRKNVYVILFGTATCPLQVDHVFPVSSFKFQSLSDAPHFVLQNFYMSQIQESTRTSPRGYDALCLPPVPKAARPIVYKLQAASPYYPFGQSGILAVLKIFPSSA